jgi:hypothetical protein
MQKEELEEKVTMLEEVTQGFLSKMTVMETEVAGVLNQFINQYRNTLESITARIEISNRRYDDRKIQQQIDELKRVVDTVPKIISVRNMHHFGVWSKSLIIGLAAGFMITAVSVGTALYLNHQNDRLNSEAYNFWLVRALYPEVAKKIETRLEEDSDSFIKKAEKAMTKQQAIIAAEAEAAQAENDQKEAKRKLEQVKSW